MMFRFACDSKCLHLDPENLGDQPNLEECNCFLEMPIFSQAPISFPAQVRSFQKTGGRDEQSDGAYRYRGLPLMSFGAC